jgi:DNA-binding PadR family transcriptional regulator
MFGHRHGDRHARGGMFGIAGGRFGGHRHGGGAGGGRVRLGRFFDHGDLRYVLLGLIAEQPRHGYELIKAIEEKFGGLYSPSPGVVYPTLTLLEELGYIRPDSAEGPRKQFIVTPEGEAFLAANRAVVDQIFAHGGGQPDLRRRAGAGNPPRDAQSRSGADDPARARPAQRRAGARRHRHPRPHGRRDRAELTCAWCETEPAPPSRSSS